MTEIYFLNLRQAPSNSKQVNLASERSPPGDAPSHQLDLFRHSGRDQSIARAIRGLREQSRTEVRIEIEILRKHSDGLEALIDDLVSCLEALEQSHARWKAIDLAMCWIEDTLRPAAMRILDRDAQHLVNFALRALLPLTHAQAYTTTSYRGHRSYLLGLLGRSREAIDALTLDCDWAASPFARVKHLSLCRAAGDQTAELADIAELCFEHPSLAEAELMLSPMLDGLLDEFCELDPQLSIHVFPAWCRLLHALPFKPRTEASDRPGEWILELATRMSGQTAGDLSLRKQLQQACPPLLSAWLAQGASPRSSTAPEHRN